MYFQCYVCLTLMLESENFIVKLFLLSWVHSSTTASNCPLRSCVLIWDHECVMQWGLHLLWPSEIATLRGHWSVAAIPLFPMAIKVRDREGKKPSRSPITTSICLKKYCPDTNAFSSLRWCCWGKVKWCYSLNHIHAIFNLLSSDTGAALD